MFFWIGYLPPYWLSVVWSWLALVTLNVSGSLRSVCAHFLLASSWVAPLLQGCNVSELVLDCLATFWLHLRASCLLYLGWYPILSRFSFNQHERTTSNSFNYLNVNGLRLQWLLILSHCAPFFSLGTGSSILCALQDLPLALWPCRSKMEKHLQVISVLQWVITFLAMGKWGCEHLSAGMHFT